MESFVESLERIGPNTITPDHVRGLSISETSAQFGSLGLYLKLEDLLEKSGLSLDHELNWSLHFALALHANDRRTNGHYADHVLRVGLRIIHNFGIEDKEILAAAFLHDTVEDHPLDIVRTLGQEIDPEAPKERALLSLLGHVSPEIVNLVEKLTFVPSTNDYEEKNEEYVDYVNSIVKYDAKARVIKLSDFIDNAVGNHYTNGAKRAKLDKKYLPLYRIHMMGLYMPDSLIPENKRNELVKQLTKAQFRSLGRVSLSNPA